MRGAFARPFEGVRDVSLAALRSVCHSSSDLVPGIVAVLIVVMRACLKHFEEAHLPVFAPPCLLLRSSLQTSSFLSDCFPYFWGLRSVWQIYEVLLCWASLCLCVCVCVREGFPASVLEWEIGTASVIWHHVIPRDGFMGQPTRKPILGPPY